MRPRGWHLVEKHVLVDGKPVSGRLFDFGLYFFHNAKALLARGTGPYFYLPKMESHLEARLWNDVFVAAQDALGVPHGTHQGHGADRDDPRRLRDGRDPLRAARPLGRASTAAAGTTSSRCIKKFRTERGFLLADRAQVTMTTPLHARLLAAADQDLPPPQASTRWAAWRRRSRSRTTPRPTRRRSRRCAPTRCARRPTATTAPGWRTRAWCRSRGRSSTRSCATPNQIDKKRDDVNVTAADLLKFGPEGPITEAGLRNNINVGIQYLGAWLAGTGCVPIYNLMEDAATAEISRSQVWQWIRSPKGVLDDGRKVDEALFRQILGEEMVKIRAERDGDPDGYFAKGAELFDEDLGRRHVRRLPDPARVRPDRLKSRGGRPGAPGRPPTRRRS